MRIWAWVALVLAAGVAVAGYRGSVPARPAAAPTAAAPPAAPAAPTAPTAPAAGRQGPIERPVDPQAGSDGLTVRYRSTDGTIRTVPVEDFPR
jgi:hypothetical protein